jgi:hypothetical protein
MISNSELCFVVGCLLCAFGHIWWGIFLIFISILLDL